MSQVPPGGYPPPHADPYAADHALRGWLAARGHELNPTPDASWFQGWYPFVYHPVFVRITREVRATLGAARAFVVEAYENDPIKHATGEDRHLVAFVTSPRFTYRAALRSKHGGGLVEGIGKGLNALITSGPQPGAILGDPTLESRYDVTVPSRDEGNAALPMPLRHLLVGTGWRGILEVRSGGLVCINYDMRSFDVATLDAFIANVGQIRSAAT
jgi:hypothetical protein